MVWLWDPLNITFNTSGDCRKYGYLLYRNGDHISVPTDHGIVNGDEFFTFMINNVTKDFDNASMKVIGTNGGHFRVKKFTIRTQGQCWCNIQCTVPAVTLISPFQTEVHEHIHGTCSYAGFHG